MTIQTTPLSVPKLKNNWTLTDCRFGHLRRAHRHPPQATARGQYTLASFADEEDDNIYSEDRSIHPLMNSTFPPILAWGVPRKEIFTLSMQKCFSIAAFSSSPLSQGFCSQPALALTQTCLLLLSLRAMRGSTSVWQGYLHISAAHLMRALRPCPPFCTSTCPACGLWTIHQERSSLECQLG